MDDVLVAGRRDDAVREVAAVAARPRRRGGPRRARRTRASTVGAIDAAYVGNGGRRARDRPGDDPRPGDAAAARHRGHPDLQRRERLRVRVERAAPRLAGRRGRDARRRAVPRAPRSSRTRTRRVGMAAIGTAVDVEAQAEMAEALGGDAATPRKRSFFMDIYAGMARAYMQHSGATARHFAEVVVKNQHNGARNPRAQYGGELTVEDVLGSRADRRPAHAADVLADLRRRGRGRARRRARGRPPAARLARASAPRSCVSGNRHDKADPSAGLGGRARRARPTSRRAWAPTISTAPRSTTPARPPSSSSTSSSAWRRPAAARSCSSRAAPGWTATCPSTRAAGCSARATRSARPASRRSARPTWQLRGEAGDAPGRRRPRRADPERRRLARGGLRRHVRPHPHRRLRRPPCGAVGRAASPETPSAASVASASVAPDR